MALSSSLTVHTFAEILSRVGETAKKLIDTKKYPNTQHFIELEEWQLSQLFKAYESYLRYLENCPDVKQRQKREDIQSMREKISIHSK